MNMRLLGAPTIADVVPSMVDISALGYSNGGLTMYDANCECYARRSCEALTKALDERMIPAGVKAKL